jgi:DNA-directed RNA polymerase subunit RPC12/RpoP
MCHHCPAKILYKEKVPSLGGVSLCGPQSCSRISLREEKKFTNTQHSFSESPLF